jgi:hypothetical protein
MQFRAPAKSADLTETGQCTGERKLRIGFLRSWGEFTADAEYGEELKELKRLNQLKEN